jgi:uracil-DNA glycosylase family 4
MGEEAVILPFQEERPTFDAEAAGANCSVCPLRVPNPVGPSPARGKTRLVIVGEGPGRYEETVGKPFIGPSGKLLDRVMMECGIERRHAHVTNTMLCRPESEDQIPGMVYACSRRLFRELKELDASAPIVALGKESAKALLGAKGILKARGFVWEVPGLKEGETRKKLRRERVKAKRKGKESTVFNLTLKLRRSTIAGRVVFPTLHPAFILRSEIWSPVLDIDMGRVAKYLAQGCRIDLEDESPFRIVSSARELRKMLRRFRKQDVLVDIETDGIDPLSTKLLCVGFGITGEKRRTMVLYPWSDDCAPIMQELFDGGAKLVGHNVIGFDCIVLERYGVSVGILKKAATCEKVEDTLIAHHSFASHLPKSLAHVASVFCDSRPWKILAKGSGKSEKGLLPQQLTPKQLTKYNAADVSLNALAWERMQNDLVDERAVYETTKRLGALCARMRWHGFAFDMPFAKSLYRQLQARKQSLLWEMRELLGDDDFKPSKAFDLRQVLFTRLKVPLIYPTKSGLPATSRVVLEQLRFGQDLAGRIADLTLRWRDCHKTQSTYLSVEPGKDGRVHADWRIATVSGRLGGRLLTLPRFVPDKTLFVEKIAKFEKKLGRKPDDKEKKAILGTCIDITDQVRACYIAPPGRVLVYFDLSQAEMRYAANLSGDPVFIAACKGDVHAGNARVLFPAEERDGFFATDAEAKDGRGKPFRDIAKNAGFAVTYLAEADTVYVYLNAHGFPVSLMEVRSMLDRLHVAYKGYFDYVARNVAFVKENGWLRSVVSGRIRYFGHTPKPTEVANFPVQTGIADMMNVRLLDVEALLPASAFIIAQIHDAAIIEADEKDVELVSRIIHDVYDPPVCLPGRNPFFVPIDLKVKQRWSEL